MKKVNIGLIGFGTIGSGVVQVLTERRRMLKELTGVEMELKYICDKDIKSARGVKVDKKLLTKDVNKILKNPDIDIVIELVGGVHPAKEFILTALKNGKDVVTANKALLAEEGRAIFEAARRLNKEVRFEASVGGGIPIIKALREGLVSNQLNEICGIINGTCNYILSRMSEQGCDYEVALRAAQKMGIAEADPKLDVKGLDSAHKIILLAGLSFGVFPKMSQVHYEGILAIEPRDIRYASQMGYAIKLLAIAKRCRPKNRRNILVPQSSQAGLDPSLEDGKVHPLGLENPAYPTRVGADEIEVRVHPTLVPNRHLLANVSGVYNAIYVKADLTGETLFYGEGAGKFPAASAVVADIVDLGKKIRNSNVIPAPAKAGEAGIQKPVVWMPSFAGMTTLKIKKMDEIESRYYIRFTTLDKPGVLAKIAGILGKNSISIASVSQKEVHSVKAVPIVIMTHSASERNLRKALGLIDELPVVKKRSVAIRVESL